MICAKNAGIDASKPHIATKWVTLMFFRLWPMGTYKVQLTGGSAVGVPFIGGLFTSKYAILGQLPWTSNWGHIVRSLIVGWGFLVLVAYAYLHG